MSIFAVFLPGDSVIHRVPAGAKLAVSDTLDLTGARRWFTSFGSCDVDEPLADLRALGLIDA